MLHDGPTLVITALGADRVSRNGRTALRAVADLTLFDAIVRTPLAGSAVGVFSFWDSHRRGSVGCIGNGIEPRIVETAARHRQRSRPPIFGKMETNYRHFPVAEDGNHPGLTPKTRPRLIRLAAKKVNCTSRN